MKIIQTHKESKKIILRVMIVGIVANIVLVAAKAVLGFVHGNMAVLSDAAHSATDLITSVAIVAVVFLSSPKRDKKHNYGHEKIEPLALLFFSLLIAGLGVILVWQGISGIIAPEESGINWYLIGVTMISIIIKEALFWYGIYYSKKIKSQMLRADAWHSRTDSLASLAVLIGLIFSIFIGTDIAESIAVLLVAALIFKVAFGILRPAVRQLTDTAASEDVCKSITDTALQVEGVLDVKNLLTRMFGNKIYVDITIEISGDLTASAAHTIMQKVHDCLESKEELDIKHCTVGMFVADG